MVIKFDETEGNRITDHFYIIEMTNSRELIFHQTWKEELKDLKLMIVPKSKCLLKSQLSIVNDYFVDWKTIIDNWEKLWFSKEQAWKYYEFLDVENKSILGMLIDISKWKSSISIKDIQDFVYNSVLLW